MSVSRRFNPSGTIHRDSFVLADGRFLAVSISDHEVGMRQPIPGSWLTADRQSVGRSRSLFGPERCRDRATMRCN
jgi:hypothetical protein